MSPFVEPRFQRLGNTFVNDPSDAEEERGICAEEPSPCCRRRAHSFGHRSAAHDSLQQGGGSRPGQQGAGALSGQEATPAAEGPRASPRPGRPRTCNLGDLGPPTPSGQTGQDRCVPEAPERDSRRRRRARALYDSSVPQTPVEGGAAAAPGRERGPCDSNVPQAPTEGGGAVTPGRRERGLCDSNVPPQTPNEGGAAVTPGRSRAPRGGKARGLYDSNVPQAPSAPGSPDAQRDPAVTIADLLRTGSTAMMKATTLAHKMSLGGDPAKGWGSTCSTCSPAESPLGACSGRTPTARSPLKAPAAPPFLAAAAVSPTASWSLGAWPPEGSHPRLPILLGSPAGAAPR